MTINYYSPFTDDKGNQKDAFEINYNDLQQIKDKEIEEGFQIEYKRELSDSIRSKLAKIITSFANERGGWLFIGVDEIDRQIKPIPKKEYELEINNNLLSNTSPIPEVIIRFLTPENDDSNGVLVIRIPEGDNPPYIAKGRIYRRVGSGSSPIQEIDDRYYLDRLYRKADDNIDQLRKFCQKEISIFSRRWSPVGYRYIDLGMCNIYLIPTLDLDLLQLKTPEDIAEFTLKESKVIREYEFEGGKISLNIPFEKYSYSLGSIIFRNNLPLDYYHNEIAWELFYDGSAKFHLPIPYVSNQQNIKNTLTNEVINYRDSKIFDDFEYIDGKTFLYCFFGCLGIYIHCMKSLRDFFDEIKIAVELNNVRRNVLYFDVEIFRDILRKNGLPFSDKNDYFMNERFTSIKIETNNLLWYILRLVGIFNAFGLPWLEGIQCLVQSSGRPEGGRP